MQEVTQLTQVTLLTNSTKHKKTNLKQIMQKMEVTNFRNFCLKNSGISGLGGKRNFRKSGNRNFWNCNHYSEIVFHKYSVPPAVAALHQGAPDPGRGHSTGPVSALAPPTPPNLNLHRVRKKCATLFFAITLPNPNRSSKFFYRYTQQ